jgi:long-chain acyl-CoA synthetase
MIVTRVLEIAKKCKDKTIIKTRDQSCTYDQLINKMLSICDFIKASGISDGEPIGLIFPNSIEFVTSLLAAEYTGHPALLLGAMYKPREISYHVNSAHLSLVLGAPELKGFMAEAGGKSFAGPEATIECWKFDSGTEKHKFKTGDFICQLTSGTNGLSKGVIRTSEAVISEIEDTLKEVGFVESDRLLTIPPINHSFGLIAGTLAPLYCGAQLILLDSFKNSEVKMLIETEKVTVLFAVPFMYHMLTQLNTENTDFSSLRLCFSAGAPLHKNVSETFYYRFGITICQDYGSTETGVMCLNMSSPKLLESAGKPVGSRKLKAFGENGEILGAGEKGELMTSSTADLRCYLYPEELNKTTFYGGWLSIGDIGFVDENGYVYVQGRKSNLINVAGMKVDPNEVEKVIMSLPEVKEAAVVGIDSESGSQIVKAVIVANDINLDTKTVIHFCIKHLSSFKIPRIIEFVDELPRTQTGKVLKKNLV